MFRVPVRAAFAALAISALTAGGLSAQTGEEGSLFDPPAESGVRVGPMTGARLLDLVTAIDQEAAVGPNGAEFTFGERQVVLVFDEAAGRMRMMTPVAPVDALGERIMRRMLQANFDAVLDARYAIAGDLAWSTFIHPLPTLTEEDFRSALVQTVVAAETFGTTFSSGALVFGGGDSSELHEELLESLNPGRGI